MRFVKLLREGRGVWGVLHGDVVRTLTEPPFEGVRYDGESLPLSGCRLLAPCWWGCKDVITPKHFAVMKHNAILTNAGHFDCEVDVAGLAAMAVKRELRRDNIEGFTLPDGRVLNVIGEGRLVNLAAGNGHPAEIMDMSFSVQALALEWLVKHRDGLEKKVYQVPAEIDDAIGRVKLAAMGLSIDALTPEQEEYLNGWKA